jgi:hypothetical protein
MRRLVLALLLFGCPGKQPVDPAHTAAGPKPCEKMADHLVSLMSSGHEKDKPTDSYREVQDKLTRLLIERCTVDKWTIDAQQCVEKIKTQVEFADCAPLLTVDQRDALTRTLDNAFPKEPGAGSDAP